MVPPAPDSEGARCAVDRSTGGASGADWSGIWNLIDFSLLVGSVVTLGSIGPRRLSTVVLCVQFLGAGDRTKSSQQALALVDAIPCIQGGQGRPRHRPDCMIGDRGYDAQAIRVGLRQRGIRPLLARRNTKHGSGLGRYRWVIERTFAWLNQFRRFRVRYEKRADLHEALLSLACVLICRQFLKSAGISG